MNIAIFAGYYYPHIGGYEKNVHELAKRLVSNGYIIEVVTCNTEGDPIIEMHDGVHIQRLRSIHLLKKTFPVPIDFPYCPHKYDIVITQTRFFPICFIGMLFAKLKGIPLIHVERGTCHSVVSNKLVSVIAQIYDHTLGSLIVKSADVNVGVSNAACIFIEHLGGYNTKTIYNGIE